MRHKITDGDLILVQADEAMSEKNFAKLGEIIGNWCRSKGLKNVSANLIPTKGSKIEVVVLSVNDVFEEEVLKD